MVGDQKNIFIYGGVYKNNDKAGYAISDRLFQYDLLLNKIKEIKPLVPDKSKPKKKTFWPPALAHHQSWLGNYQDVGNEQQKESQESQPTFLFIFGGAIKYEPLDPTGGNSDALHPKLSN